MKRPSRELQQVMRDLDFLQFPGRAGESSKIKRSLCECLARRGYLLMTTLIVSAHAIRMVEFETE